MLKKKKKKRSCPELPAIAGTDCSETEIKSVTSKKKYANNVNKIN